MPLQVSADLIKRREMLRLRQEEREYGSHSAFTLALPSHRATAISLVPCRRFHRYNDLTQNLRPFMNVETMKKEFNNVMGNKALTVAKGAALYHSATSRTGTRSKQQPQAKGT